MDRERFALPVQAVEPERRLVKCVELDTRE
jgi:hypothetical protein